MKSRCLFLLGVVFVALVMPLSALSSDTPVNRLVKAAISSIRPIVADFGKGQCVQCNKQAEAIEVVESRLGDKVGFEFVHVVKEASLTGRYQIFMIPTLVFLDSSGEEVYRYVGLLEADELQKKIEELWF